MSVRHRWNVAVPILAIITVITALVMVGSVQAATSLNNDQRRAYLRYYAPIIFKKGNGNGGEHGRDWITNFDFDGDFNFGNNKANYENVNRYIDAAAAGQLGAYRNWDIRPTLYTFLIEYTQGSNKSLILTYHVYHAMDQKAGNPINFKEQNHDWERIEVRIERATGIPGSSGEYVKDVVITQHDRSVIRRRGSSELLFDTTATGKHVMIWQAMWSAKLTNQHGQELRFVREKKNWVHGSGRAEVKINGASNNKNVHYIFVPAASSSAVSAYRAKRLTHATARSLTSFRDDSDRTKWKYIPKITYELQDIADILPTHWSLSNYTPHWEATERQTVQMDQPIINEQGGVEVTIGRNIFFTKTRDIQNEDKRGGYPAKQWFWGVHDIFGKAGDPIFERALEIVFTGSSNNNFYIAAYDGRYRDKFGRSRGDANGIGPSVHGQYWYQHDYFVHDGTENSADLFENGFFLTRGWHLPSRGGFDGRWVQLFDDPGNTTPPPPPPPPPPSTGLTVSVAQLVFDCGPTQFAVARATGGAPPYTYVWKNAGGSVFHTETGDYSTNDVLTGQRTTVSATGQNSNTGSGSFIAVERCGGGDDPFRRIDDF